MDSADWPFRSCGSWLRTERKFQSSSRPLAEFFHNVQYQRRCYFDRPGHMNVWVTAQCWLLSSAGNMRTSFYQSVALPYCIAPPINLLGLVAEQGRDNIVVLLTIRRAHLFRRQSGVIAAPLNAFQILVSNLPADSIHSGGGSADRVFLTKSSF
ncbi:MAG: hypothetical protein E8A46_26455 [Bradyrhizobium sp.]|jgi:hypothetical protein|uniref:hypothetical protein n=1 Tax=Bradyrhizobium sp. TaxID=376 RepID=UPI00121C8511|nr:hypothetical protein [Bradyrhizobium sp.]THD46549.1 MAG: hypothetical protein E8A46_26455 [Bradyrhizobium sp.]